MSPKRVCLIAAPLTARSGVYNSSRELVREARAQGHNWFLYLGVSSKAGGSPPSDDPSWIVEEQVEPSGISGVWNLSRKIQSMAHIVQSDVIISLTPQTDMALAPTNREWISYLRGLPWPAPGEAAGARTVIWRALERASLSRAADVWATTEVLKSDAALSRAVRIVPPGIAPLQRTWDGRGHRSLVVWAARYDQDKNPHLFLDLMRGSSLSGVMYGSGPLEEEVRQAAPSNVEVRGWVRSAALWDGALAYVGTSRREAFGRSAVEAAMSGIPLVVSSSFGAVPSIYTDDAYSSTFVMHNEDPAAWRRPLEELSENEDLRVAYSEYLHTHGSALSIERSVKHIVRTLNHHLVLEP